MKPRFSIWTLLIVTAFLAMMFVALLEPDTAWRYAATIGWMAVLAYLLILAIDGRHREQANFGRVAVACVAAYLWLTWPPGSSTSRFEVFPHNLLTEWWKDVALQRLVASEATYTAGFGPRNPFSGYWTREKLQGIEALMSLNVALVFGLMGGWWAQRRWRRREPLDAGKESA